ncbi:MAG TPA: RNA polymerase sigma factor [Bryobacteraceae bacterium]|nr:RNA polymerase sigma factor [Bryobacteraceae bacterium]
MEDVLSGASSNDRLTDIFRREQGRLRNFVRSRISDEGDAEDILQDVFSQLVEADRLMKPVERVGAWLYRVARNRIIDFFRKRRPVQFDEDSDGLSIQELLPSPDGGPEAAFLRTLMWEELEDALDELPDEQRDAFLAHEIDGRSFQEISEETGVSVNTLISRKHYAVLHLRERLKEINETILGEKR